MYKIIIALNEEKILNEEKYTIAEIQKDLMKIINVYELAQDENGCFYSSHNDDDDIKNINGTICRTKHIFDNLSLLIMINNRGESLDCIKGYKEFLRKKK